MTKEAFADASLSTEELLALVNEKYRGGDKGGTYSRALEIRDRTGDQISAARKEIEAFNGKTYNVFFRNCLDAVKSAVSAAGYSFEGDGRNIPNIWTGGLYLRNRTKGLRELWAW